jgi:hypothetical protein
LEVGLKINVKRKITLVKLRPKGPKYENIVHLKKNPWKKLPKI